MEKNSIRFSSGKNTYIFDWNHDYTNVRLKFQWKRKESVIRVMLMLLVVLRL